MRNPERLKPIYDHIKGIHKEHFPKLEFGPFIKKFFDWYKQDPFYVEDCLVCGIFDQFAVEAAMTNDPARPDASGIDMAYDYICDMHKTHYPDWRFFQLMFNVFSEYGEELTAIVKKDNIFGCQFHPEKSGAVGLQILKNFCEVNL